MGITDTVFGTPGQTTVHQTPGTRDPGYNFAKWLFGQLPGLAQSPFPTYGGQIDPGLSPTMMDVIKRAQGYGQSGTPGVLSDVQGSLGRFMSPSFQNPWNSLFGGSPNYGGVDPNTRVFGGAPAGGMTFQSPFQQPGGGASTPGPPGPATQIPQIPGVPMSDADRQASEEWFNKYGPMRAMTGAPQASTPSFNSMPSPAASMPGYNPSFSGTTDPNVFNSPEFVAWNNQFQNKPFHSTDYQSAWEQLNPGQTMSEADRVAAWMRGDTSMIEEARKSFQAQAPGVGQESWTPAERRMNDLINQFGLNLGSKKFEEEVASGAVQMPGGPGGGVTNPVVPPPPGSTPPPPGPSKSTAVVTGQPGGPSAGAGGGAPAPGITPGSGTTTRTGSPFGGGAGTPDSVTGPPSTAPGPGSPAPGSAKERFLKFMGEIPRQYRKMTPLDYTQGQAGGPNAPAAPTGAAETNWRDYWRQTLGRQPRQPGQQRPPGPGPTDQPVMKPLPPNRRQRPGGGG